MTWKPGKSGNPNGYKGPRDRARREVFETIKNLGHKDALETLSYLQHNEQIEPGLRIAAAAALAPYCHPKMQATPTPRFIDLQLDIPEFTHVSDAENFLAKIALLVARGHLDIQSGQELSALVRLGSIRNINAKNSTTKFHRPKHATPPSASKVVYLHSQVRTSPCRS